MSGNAQKPVLVVCGPTASGKSTLAIDVALAFGGTVVNADSMQVYRELRILTARPSSDDERRVPHRLYGIVPVDDPFSAGRWRELAAKEIRRAHADDRLPILCGGTGMYLKALMEGLSTIPDIPSGVRKEVRRRVVRDGPQACHVDLAARDPETASRVPPGDTQRITRALEVLEATGKPLSEWQKEKGLPPDPHWRFHTILLEPPRETLNPAIDKRFDRMIEAGALAEVEALAGLDPTLPALKAVGLPDLRRLLEGEIDEETAFEQARRATRQYAKRQVTWFANQIIADLTILSQYSKSMKEKIFSFIRDNVLTPTF